MNLRVPQVVLQKQEQQMVRWEAVSVRARLHAQIEPIQVARRQESSASGHYQPEIILLWGALVFDLPVVVPASGRDGKRERMGDSSHNNLPLGTGI